MTLIERVNAKKNQGFTDELAESLIGQEIIIEAIALSGMTDRVLLKGGIIMYHITSSARRATRDLDFDLIRYDISNNSNIDLFIELLNKSYSDYCLKRVDKISTLHQEDYKGKRTYIEISDSTYSFRIKLDIGVHTLFAINQSNIVFRTLNNKKSISLFANPLEQVIGEKLYSLAKHSILSSRYKDIFDIYYIINAHQINKSLLNKCITLLINYGRTNIKDIGDLCERIEQTFNDEHWYKRLITSDQDWLEEKDYKKILDTIIEYVYTI